MWSLKGESERIPYPTALAFAYVTFLFLIWLWLRTKAEDYLDLPDLSGSPSSAGGGNAGVSVRSGGGGDLFGGGASGSFDGPSSLASDTSSSTSGVGDALGSAADADELAIPLVVIALAVGLALASLYVIYIAPTLLAEVLVDGALSYALYRYVRGDDPEHWLATAVRRAVVPIIATAVFLAAVGASMSAYASHARSLGEVIRGVTPSK